jgi:hypothetical protein
MQKIGIGVSVLLCGMHLCGMHLCGMHLCGMHWSPSIAIMSLSEEEAQLIPLLTNARSKLRSAAAIALSRIGKLGKVMRRRIASECCSGSIALSKVLRMRCDALNLRTGAIDCSFYLNKYCFCLNKYCFCLNKY